MTTEQFDHAREQAEAQRKSVADMVRRLGHAQDCDWRGDPELCEYVDPWILDALEEEGTMGIATDEQWTRFHDEDDARQRINEDALSVEVRSGWQTPGEDFTAAEFSITLCTGGPAVRIRGLLDNYGVPDTAWLEYQDWGTPWATYFGDDLNTDDLLAYAQQFLGG